MPPIPTRSKRWCFACGARSVPESSRIGGVSATGSPKPEGGAGSASRLSPSFPDIFLTPPARRVSAPLRSAVRRRLAPYRKQCDSLTHLVSIMLRCALSLTALAMASPLYAQTSDSAGTTSYAADFFTRSQPTTAYDMVALLPGFRLQEGNAEVRGYSGSGGNVLIDGTRPASKEETLEKIGRAHV